MNNQGRIYAWFLMEETGDQVAAYNVEFVPRAGDEVRLTNSKWYEVVRVQVMYDTREETIRIIIRFNP